MMKFLDLNTGYTIDALWSDDQTKGYIFWFPKEQSIGLTYTMPIAFVNSSSESLEITMETNDVFSFISNSGVTEDVNGYIFDGGPVYSQTFNTTPELVGDNYVHVFNIAAKAKDVGEYVCKVKIGNVGYIRVGFDAYGEDESLYVNFSNMGIEIPTSIQKAIYDTNVHEDATDNILINRKFKELLTNYWDIIANKGSYRSLLNALEWFEWNDELKIKEIIKHKEANKFLFSDKSIMSQFENKIEESFNNFMKTTYISLYCSLQNETPNYDNEYNPVLADAALKWTRNDIQLKISLLAQFFGIYFMPMHMSILHATAEDLIFTNTIKAIHGAEIKRDDNFGDFNYVECNIKDDAIYKMTNVSTQVSAKTVYGVKNGSSIFGVEVFPTNSVVDPIVFDKQYYTGPGVIIPIELVIPNQAKGDFVKQTLVEFTTETGVERLTFNDKFVARRGNIRINFNFLAKSARDYELRFTFVLGTSKTISRLIKFTVEDADNLNINIYKVKAKDDSNGFTKNDFVDMTCSKYMFKIQKTNDASNKYYTQYLPYMLPNNDNYSSYNGIKLTRTVVFDVLNDVDYDKPIFNNKVYDLHAMMTSDVNNHGYLEFAKYDYDDMGNKTLKYLIYVSKRFNEQDPTAMIENIVKTNNPYEDEMYNKYNIIRNDLGFYPQFHYLEKMDGNTIDNYTISPYDAVCCAAEINKGDNVEEFRYGHMIEGSEWLFHNHLTNETIKHPNTSRTPFIANNKKELMQPGYYDVTFRYSLTNGVTGECKLNSAFRIK